MSGFRSRLLRGFAGLVLLTVAGGALQLIAPEIADTAASYLTGDGQSANYEVTVRVILAAGISLIGYALAWHFTRTLDSNLCGDAARLQTAVQHLTTLDKNLPPGKCAYQELEACHNALAEVAEALREQKVRLNHDASRDPLTELPNRRVFHSALAHETAVARRTGWPVSLIMVDLDHFKNLNDTYGHQAGDFVLRRVARRLASLVRQADIVARYGGEEFAVILPGTRIREATQVAQQLRNALRCDRLMMGEHELHVTASFGVAETYVCRTAQDDSLVRQADLALYEAKKRGRDTVVAAPATDTPTAATTVGDALGGPGATEPDAAHGENRGNPIDRDTMALMGSLFSILQVIPDKHRVAQDLVQQVAAVLHSPEVSLLMFEESSNRLVPMSSFDTGHDAARTGFEASVDLQAWFTELRNSAEFHPAGDIEPTLAELGAAGQRVRAVRLPLVVYGEVFGAIEAILDSDAADISERQQTILGALGTIGATALRSCGAYEIVEERWLALTEALCRTIHSRDAYKRDHAENVSHIALELARALGQSDPNRLQLVRVAGLVHDIGKIGLSPRLFDKKARLRTAERKMMQEHCAIGARLLQHVPHMNGLAKSVLHHHEHYDGSGYPNRLAGEQIPIESRILSIADAYDAMVSPRPYRNPISHREAVERIRVASGTQFDPAVVIVFIEHFGTDYGRDLLVRENRAPKIQAAPLIAGP